VQIAICKGRTSVEIFSLMEITKYMDFDLRTEMDLDLLPELMMCDRRGRWLSSLEGIVHANTLMLKSNFE